MDNEPDVMPRDMTPKYVASDGLMATAGCAEYEEVLRVVVAYLADESTNGAMLYTGGPGVGWDKKFYLSDLQLDQAIFAMMCCDGWFEAHHFPKRTFSLSYKGRQSLTESIYQRRKRERAWMTLNEPKA